MNKFIATVETEGTINWFGEGSTIEEALADYLDNDEFNDYCECSDIKDGEVVEVCVYTTILNHSEEWDVNLYDPDYEWVLKDKVYTKLETFLLK